MSWTARIEEVLFETLLEMCRKEKQAKSGFKQEAWKTCMASVKGEMDGNPLQDHLDVKKVKSKVDVNKQR